MSTREIERDSDGYWIFEPGDLVRNIATGLTGAVTYATRRHGINVDTALGPKCWDAVWVEPVSAS